MNSKPILQVISEKVEDFLEMNEDSSAEDLYVTINEEHKESLLVDPLYKFFCTPYNEDTLENLGVVCQFTGINIVVDDSMEDITVEMKCEGER